VTDDRMPLSAAQWDHAAPEERLSAMFQFADAFDAETRRRLEWALRYADLAQAVWGTSAISELEARTGYVDEEDDS
jgi:hypothetical protein